MAARPLTLQQRQFSELNDAFVTLLREIITDNNQYSDEDSDTSDDNISLSSTSTPSSSDDSQLESQDPPSIQVTALETLIDTYLHLSDQIQTTRRFSQYPPAPRIPQFDLLKWSRRYNSSRFIRLLRVHPQTFDEILKRISGHWIFGNSSGNRQTPVEIQLAICLNQLRHYGNSSGSANIMDWAVVSLGNVEISTKHCLLAILSLHDHVIRPAAKKKKKFQRNGWRIISVHFGTMDTSSLTAPIFHYSNSQVTMVKFFMIGNPSIH